MRFGAWRVVLENDAYQWGHLLSGEDRMHFASDSGTMPKVQHAKQSDRRVTSSLVLGFSP